MFLVIAVGVLIVVMSALSMPVSGIIKTSKLPASVKLNPSNSWG